MSERALLFNIKKTPEFTSKTQDFDQPLGENFTILQRPGKI